jgi:hypothetical protein
VRTAGRLAAADSAEYREPLIDAREDRVGHDAEHRAGKGASDEVVRQKPADKDCQFAPSLAILAARQCRDTGDVSLYAHEHDGLLQLLCESAADIGLQGPQTTRRGTDRQRPMRFQVSRPGQEEFLLEADGLLSVGAGGVANYVPRNYLGRGRRGDQPPT